MEVFLLNIILLSGGSGQRLWPLSNGIRSKQFINVLEAEDGTRESMVQRVYHQIKKIDSSATVTIATSKSQVSSIRNQLGEKVGISVEPYRRDTFPAIILASVYLYEIKHVSTDEPIVVCPVDPYVEDDYFKSLSTLSRYVEVNGNGISLMGITPTYPSEKYGYIIPKNSNKFSEVLSFKEKPDADTAQKYLDKGGLWNGGVFAFKLSYVLDLAHKMLEFTGYSDLLSQYKTIEKISFDYAVLEKEPHIQVMRYVGEWRDLGTWNTLTDAMQTTKVGKVIMDKSCSNSNVVNELDIPIIAMGLRNLVVSASPQGILVSDKEKSALIKPLVEMVDDQIKFAEKSWGKFRILDVEESGIVVRLSIVAGRHLSYQSHAARSETWNVISGVGDAIIEGKVVPIHAGSTINIPLDVKHSLVAKTDLSVIEVQTGSGLVAKDKCKYPFDFENFQS